MADGEQHGDALAHARRQRADALVGNGPALAQLGDQLGVPVRVEAADQVYALRRGEPLEVAELLGHETDPVADGGWGVPGGVAE